MSGKNKKHLRSLDSSRRCYATAVYIRASSENQWTSRLIFAEARLSPSKEVSIPRLELFAVLIDWISSAKTLPKFVENRVSEIRNTERIKFMHIAGEENPADKPTRGCTSTQLRESGAW
ncbi:unnamed protein product [Enterobius vermicularis]|uniref:Resolvase/invertase-type recombinase catalytic domain-containing protein n=1 Tax=Enterobius vermicularis TaxID=51028 RepID=A0A0N4VIS8_ENTVE|nr:unnamed protein product [Enterobius vermicularis]